LKGTKKDLSLELALACADLAEDGKAIGTTTLDLREVSSVADYFVIASGRSHIQVDAIGDRIVKGVQERLGRRPIAVEGLEQALWGVLDYGSVVVHVFQESVRELYDLERLWSLAPRWKYEDGPPEAKPEAKTKATTVPKAKAAPPEKAKAKTTAKAAKAAPKKATKKTTRTATKAATKPEPKAPTKPAAKKSTKASTKPTERRPARKTASAEA